MANIKLDHALDTLNTARALFNPEVVHIYICGDNEGVEVDWLALPTASGGALSHITDAVEEAANVVTGAMGESSTMILCCDHRNRWVLVPND